MSTINLVSWIAVCATIVLLAPSAPAQVQFDELPKQQLLPEIDTTHAVALGDVDGDGDLDLAFGNSAQNRLYLNAGNAAFTDVTVTRMPPGGNGKSVALGDVDADGDFDLIFQDRLLLNDGTGTFTDAPAGHLPTSFGTYGSSIVLGDVDGDGDLDALLGRDGYIGTTWLACGSGYSVPAYFPQPNLLYLNDGTGVFAEAATGYLPDEAQWTKSVALGDVDGDGDLDAVIGNSGYAESWCDYGGAPYFYHVFEGPVYGPNRLYLNDGTGVFADVTASHLPSDSDETRAVALGDLDGDGDLDLVLGNHQGWWGPDRNRLYLNDGTGLFNDATATTMPPDGDGTNALALADVDVDGDLDLVFGNGDYGGQQNRLYLNDGGATFMDATATHLPPDGGSSEAAALGDLDGDGDVELVVANAIDEPNRLYFNDGNGIFTDPGAPRMPPDTDEISAVAFGDVDNDGDSDLVLGNASAYYVSQQNRLYLNDGSAAFTDVTAAHMPLDTDRTRAVALGDVDGDGDVDLICGNTDVQNRLYLNDGTGLFADASSARLPADSDSTLAVALGDVDGDGDVDVVFGNWRQQNRLYLNSGSGMFIDVTATHMPLDSDQTLAVALGDTNGDGKPDLVCGNGGALTGQQNRLYLNDGTGAFYDATATHMPTDNEPTRAVALVDVDRDADADLVFANDGGQNHLYLNDGLGTFIDATAARMPTDSDTTEAVAVGDVDQDGDFDLVFGNGQQNRLYLNDATGTFTDATAQRMPTDGDRTCAAILADADADGDPDLIFGNDGQNRLYLNLLRQLDAPLVARLGQPYQLDAYARYGPTGTVNMAAPFISTGTASIPLPPLGTFALDPAQMIRLPAFIILQPEGLGSQSFVVPDLPALVGVSVYAQALIVQYPVKHRLTNWTTDVIMQ